ncbi:MULTISPECIES: nicotinate phosphoribosyltransferase [Alphaproteobacteria]|uniref:Nicotinamide phosphoribosyltransferase n=2 Tax=Alphaproteobacteria TaxID=28211 RepID=A0A512HIR1_9HYPH|nr:MULTISPECIES: nicotinate phosphoribosyltransferase [Alphaproteobacteria]GEO85312.1 nicotinate phosphoribosyltransferase [Ciceribacter naphthalenivorans]GLR20951.1 nicotinate phosphoribosyltransferase [Ciceribacter naphthalenivorans]GLT03807.1 nicotinate phosphoribosyltransferase [Sphingomonas psychrolutea]
MNHQNPILNTDSYKLGHYMQYPEGVRAISSYATTRGYSYKPEVMFFGLQMFLKEYLTQPITMVDIDEAEEIATLHGQPFDRAGWLHVLNAHGGHLPLRIEALPEGIAVRRGVPVVQVVNTDPQLAWLTSYMETALLRAIWYPSTVATLAWRLRQTIQPFLERTSDRVDELMPRMVSDFGARSTTSLEQTAIGGVAHLVHFHLSDSLPAILQARRSYGALMAGHTVPASEHTTMTAWGQARESEAFANMIDRFGRFGAYSVVSDSYDLHNAVAEVWGKTLQTRVRAAGATLIVRPDSGDPIDTPVQVIAQLAYAYGTRLNARGFKVLDEHVRVIQSDGVTLQDIQMILGRLEGMGFAAENISFGVGSTLLQKLSRDTLSFTMLSSAMQNDDGTWQDIGRRPANPNERTLDVGRRAVVRDGNDILTIRLGDIGRRENLLRCVWQDGRLIKDWSFEEIRRQADAAMQR